MGLGNSSSRGRTSRAIPQATASTIQIVITYPEPNNAPPQKHLKFFFAGSERLIDDDAILLAYCDKYLCPQTLACVHFPHHCPCPWPATQDKIELAEGSMACASKGGFKAGEAARKIELARKGLL